MPIAETSYGFAKRLNFVASSIREVFPERAPTSIKILDVGCGTGNLLALPLSENGFNITGIDIHGPSIEYAREKAAAIPNLKFECIAVSDCIPQSFDVVIASEVLEHITDYQAFFLELLKAIRPGGLLLLTIPNGYGPFEWQNWVWRKLEPLKFVKILRARRRARRANAENFSFLNSDSIHVNFFSMRRILKLFQDSGMPTPKYEGRAFLNGRLASPVIDILRLSGLNSKLGSLLPSVIVSGWMFALRKPGAL